MNMILGDPDDPIRMVEWKRHKWLTAFIPDSDIKIVANCLSSLPQAIDFSIILIRLLRKFFFEFIWVYRNKKMKTKEESLNINVKNMALMKKCERVARSGNAGTSRQRFSSTDLNSNTGITLSTHSTQDHLDMEQRKAWGKDLVDIATRGRIKNGSKLHWTFNRESHMLNRGKGIGFWDSWWEAWKKANGFSDNIGDVLTFNFDGGTRMV